MMGETAKNCDWAEYNHVLGKNSLSVLCINMRSIVNKFTELDSHLRLLKNKISFILVTETWLTPRNDYNFELSGYKSVSIYRDGRGGGLKLFYLKHLCISVLENFTKTSGPFESILVRTHVQGFGKLVIGGFYRPPSNSISEFLTEFDVMLGTFGSDRIIFVGDFNINTLADGHDAQDYIDLYSSYGFVNGINAPTYVSPSTNIPSSCLDHILYNLPISCQSFVIHPNLADHFAVSSIFNHSIDEPPLILKFRDFSSENIQNFTDNLEFRP